MQSINYELGASARELDHLRKQSKFLSDQADDLFGRVGIRRGWRVLDLGCGPLGVLELLANRVGPEGAVVGADNNPVMVDQARAFVAASGHKNIEIVHADAVEPKLPHGTFDLVHARLLLVNFSFAMAQKIVTEMVNLAKPGGLIVLQDVDTGTFGCDPEHPAWSKLWSTFTGFLVRLGNNDGRMVRVLPRFLSNAGAVDIQTSVQAGFCPPGHPWRDYVIRFSDATREGAIKAGMATAEEMDAARAALKAHLDKPETVVLGPVMGQVWGRKPAA